MEDDKPSTSSQRLARNFEALIKSPEAYIISIPIVRPEPFPTGNNGDIPVSVQKLVYGSKEAGVGTSANILSEEQKKKLAKGNDKSPVEASQASTSAKQGQASPKEQSEGKEKGKQNGKIQVEQALPTELQNSKERQDSCGKCVQYGKNSDGI
ncbi:hypothetical protein O181_084120 [Austropuccinia psidii MF-1]|uniref:Uncharacterized protein n=1 Tax=Austropuccinia psidii MF-1 TaxID=1389203 RepID=A0A9Q3IM78_9BASI|nr:hypothetical protein [Austropuccinia psidii MF-1]